MVDGYSTRRRLRGVAAGGGCAKWVRWLALIGRSRARMRPCEGLRILRATIHAATRAKHSFRGLGGAHGEAQRQRGGSDHGLGSSSLWPDL